MAAKAAILNFLLENFLAISNPQITLLFSVKFQVHWLFGSVEEVQNRFSKWQPGFCLERFFAILSYKIQFPPSFKSIGLSAQEKKTKIGFQDSRYSGHLGFLIGTI